MVFLKLILISFSEWFNLDDEHNTKVYVSNLPSDITETEFVDLMQKCGLVMKDLDSGKMKVKLYADPVTKTLKGDALCTYIKVMKHLSFSVSFVIFSFLSVLTFSFK